MACDSSTSDRDIQISYYRLVHCQRTAALSTETAQAGLGSHQIESNRLPEPEWEK